VPEPSLILTVNAGSSSLKLRLLGVGDEVIAEHEGSGDDDDQLREDLRQILGEGPRPEAAAHRVVHGGAEFDRATRVDPAVERQLERLADLAPLHNSQAVRAMRALDSVAPGLPTVACFDTAFHADLPAAASTYALPAAWARRHSLRRYGFHGLSHAYASRRAAELLGAAPTDLRLVTAHLGAGASLAAVAGGRSVDTTMGFTPLEGLVMATRAGSVDPGLLLWLQRHDGIGAEEMERALDRESGLLGLTGTADMREVVAGAEAGDERRALALDVYIHRLAGSIAAMATAMGGLDALVFTGGVGERSAAVRARACAATALLGPRLDPGRNEAGLPDSILSPVGTDVAAVLIAAREDVEMARQTRAVLAADRGGR
jgi:acetate kinase